MKRFVILLAIILGGFALAQFVPPDDGYGAEDTLDGLTTNVVIYGSNSAGSGLVTNTLTYTNGLLYAFP